MWYADPSPRPLLGKKHQPNTKMYYRAANWKGSLAKLGTMQKKKLAPEMGDKAIEVNADHNKILDQSVGEALAESFSPSDKTEIIKNLYCEIMKSLELNVSKGNHRNLIEMWKKQDQKKNDWNYKNMLSHEDFMHMAMIDLKNSLISMKRRGATKDDMIDALEQILRDMKSGSVTTPDVRIV